MTAHQWSVDVESRADLLHGSQEAPERRGRPRTTLCPARRDSEPLSGLYGTSVVILG
ncbi:hypothetical protein AB0B69_22040 [Micromonospora parva]|uniref:hypothetical protein n=1 Tax=Micromonospora parva TaxID=1464048 RepID=UPI0033DCD8FA